MPDTRPEDARVIRDVLTRSRDHYLIHVIAAGVLLTWFAVSKRPLDTLFGKIEILLIAGLVAQLSIAGRALVRTRRMGSALSRDGAIAQVTGWPRARFPEGSYPPYLRVVTTAGERATLRVEARELPQLVDVLSRRSPAASIEVQNIVPRADDAADHHDLAA